MINYPDFFIHLDRLGHVSLRKKLEQNLSGAVDVLKHGDLEQWRLLISMLPQAKASHVDLNSDTICIGSEVDMNPGQREELQKTLKKFHPWRKGPFEVFGIFIDSEWRSDFKWRRLQDHIQPLMGRIVLDVGCGNGYFSWRMVGSGADLVIGIEPYLLNVMQFEALNYYIKSAAVWVLPIKVEQLPANLQSFDTVFSMGVFYHRRSPMDHLSELRGHLRNGGELVLETLVIDGPNGQVLVPENRYAKMRNIWFIPSCLTLESWLKRCTFRNIRLIDVSRTRTDEQRRTAWMHHESLADQLNPQNPDLTVEGLPSPQRAIFLAEAP